MGFHSLHHSTTKQDDLRPRPSKARMWIGAVVLTLFGFFVVSSVTNTEPAGEVTVRTDSVSQECAEAFEVMRIDYDRLYQRTNYTDDEANALEVPPLNACASGTEWIAAGKQNPAALGWSDANEGDCPDFG
ncbi:hypothetical protein IWX75_003582 [Arthrobacter sp. CAN_A6]|uniref:hypothetical protein n=1 Tax=Arthrobacter sp. CAN_A6 TaxID=2787721 RepID=UPI0018CA4B95